VSASLYTTYIYTTYIYKDTGVLRR